LSLFMGRVDVLTTWNPSDEDTKDSRRVEYIRADMRTR
jgi:hypothetical protein